MSGPHRGFTTATRPLIVFLNGTANRILRLLGSEPLEELRSARSPQELGSLVQRSAHQGILPTPTAELVNRSLAFGERTAADVITPAASRSRSWPRTTRCGTVIDTAEATGHSRFPVSAAM